MSRRGHGRGPVLAGVYVGIRMAAWVSGRVAYGCVGLLFLLLKRCTFFCFLIFLLILVCFSLYQQHAPPHNSHWSLHTMVGSLRSRMAIFF